jgi:hypothetical protein
VLGPVAGSQLSLVPSELAVKGDDWQPVAGRFVEHEGNARFLPRYPFVSGMSYSLLIDGCEAATIEAPAQETAPTTRVVSIEPTAAELPANALRLYVSFSAPMSEGCAARAVQVRSAVTGEEIEDVLLPMDPELWDPLRRRLTLLIEPGRIKRGLLPNLEAGAPLPEGETIAVVVSPSFRDAAGLPLCEPAERTYRIGPPVRALVDPSAWRVTIPDPGSRAALGVSFDRPLDRGLLRRCLEVVDGRGRAVPGGANVEDGDTVWQFTPSSPWTSGSYALRVDAVLEDVAGNSVRRVFDRDLELPDDEPLDVPLREIAFAIGRDVEAQETLGASTPTSEASPSSDAKAPSDRGMPASRRSSRR